MKNRTLSVVIAGAGSTGIAAQIAHQLQLNSNDSAPASGNEYFSANVSAMKVMSVDSNKSFRRIFQGNLS